MNVEMAYLLGMICGNGEVKRGNTDTIFSIEIPHKKLKTDEHHDIKLYVKASLTDIRSIIEPLVGTGLSPIQNKSATVLSFSKPNTDYLTREILQYIGMATSHNDVRLHDRIFAFSTDEKKQFLKGFADVTAYIRRSNASFGRKHMHRVYIEIPHNWNLVIDVCNLLKDIDVPVETIDWSHPNMRDPNVSKYNEDKHSFWKKEHQIKIWANEFLAIVFGIIHKQQALDTLSAELVKEYESKNVKADNKTHLFYWEKRGKLKIKPSHPCENDDFIPTEIRGTHFNSWREIARELGYGE